MQVKDILRWIRQALRAIAIIFVFSTLIPLLLGYVLAIPSGKILGLIGSTFLLQANAAFVGVSLGLHPVLVLVIMIFVELGAVLGIFELCDAFAENSTRVARFLSSTEEKMKKMTYLSRYGVVALAILPAMPIIGLYSSVVVAWILRWNRLVSVFFITLGWIGATVFVLLIALGFVQLIV
jgi:uncharacterized membrane protein